MLALSPAGLSSMSLPDMPEAMDEGSSMDMPSNLNLPIPSHPSQSSSQHFNNPFDWEGINLPSNPSQQMLSYNPTPSTASPSAFLSFGQSSQYELPGLDQSYQNPPPPPFPTYGGGSLSAPFLPGESAQGQGQPPFPEAPHMYNPSAGTSVNGFNQVKRRHL
jgi:hypothetical protein